MIPIKTGLCAFGMSGKVFHAPFLHVSEKFVLQAVTERSKQEASQYYPYVKIYKEVEQLFSDPEIELVIVNTPNATHAAFAKKALQAGKHVVVEKPFSITIKEADELMALAQAQQKVLSVYHNRRWDSDFLVVKKVLEAKLLGEVVEAEFHYDRYREALSPKLHKEIPGPGTGALYDLGSHLIDQALQLFGRPQHLFADIRIIRPFSRVDDYFELILFYPSDLRVKLKCSYLVREPLPAYILHGNKGSFLKNRSDIQETSLQAGQLPDQADWGKEPETEWGLLHTEMNGKLVREKFPSPPGNYMGYYDNIYAAIRLGDHVCCSAEDGKQVIEIIEAAFQSAKEKKVVPL